MVHSNLVTMIIQDTSWGKIVTWGYNCEERLRDLRKLNEGFSNHHPNFDTMCLRSDRLNEKIIETIKVLDAIVFENAGRIWPKSAVDKYDLFSELLRDLKEELDALCVKEYPDGAHIFHYSYCV